MERNVASYRTAPYRQGCQASSPVSSIPGIAHRFPRPRVCLFSARSTSPAYASFSREKRFATILAKRDPRLSCIRSRARSRPYPSCLYIRVSFIPRLLTFSLSFATVYRVSAHFFVSLIPPSYSFVRAKHLLISLCGLASFGSAFLTASNGNLKTDCQYTYVSFRITTLGDTLNVDPTRFPASLLS